MANSLKCSACSGSLKPATNVPGISGLSQCRRCGGLHGSIYAGVATSLIGYGLPMQAESGPDGARYFDLSILGSAGVSRMHGWYDPRTHRIVQEG